MSFDEITKRMAELEAENARLNDELWVGRVPAEKQKLVNEHMAAGLSQEQAMAVINSQKEWEADPRHPKHQQ